MAEAKRSETERVKPLPNESKPDAATESTQSLWPDGCVEWASSMSYHKSQDRVVQAPFAQPPPECSAVASHSLSVFAVLDGHNGSSCVSFVQEYLLRYIWHFFDMEFKRNERTLDALSHAVNATFVQLHRDFLGQKRLSGTTATMLIVHSEGAVLANVGDTTAVLDNGTDTLHELTCDFRLSCCTNEVERVRMEGAEVRRMQLEGVDIGPLRVWPGGMMFARAIGDIDVHPHILPRPHLVQLPNLQQEALQHGGIRFVIASDGLWDAMTPLRSSQVWRKKNCSNAAKKLLKHAHMRMGEVSDDISILVVDIRGEADAPAPVEGWQTATIGCSVNFARSKRARTVRQATMSPFDHDSLAEYHVAASDCDSETVSIE